MTPSPGSGWQPITTAPIGREVLLLMDMSPEPFAFYALGWKPPGGEKWETSEDSNCDFTPTHWWPLPEPPEQKEE